MIFYFYGENSYTIHRQVMLLKQKYLEKTGQESDYTQIDLSVHSFSDLLDSVATQPMFVTSRLIVARQISQAKCSAKQIEKLLSVVAKSTILVLTDLKPDKRTIVFKQLKTLKHAKEFNALSRRQLEHWVLAEAKRIGLTLDSQITTYLIDRAGADQWNLANELLKLSNSSEVINLKTIDTLVAPSLESSAFDLAEAIVKKDLKRALKLYKELKIQGHADQMIFGAIVYQYRILLLTKLNSPNLNKAYKVSSFTLNKAREIGGEMGLAEIKKAYGVLRNCDLNIKSGLLDAPEAMHSTIVELSKKNN